MKNIWNKIIGTLMRINEHTCKIKQNQKELLNFDNLWLRQINYDFGK